MPKESVTISRAHQKKERVTRARARVGTGKRRGRQSEGDVIDGQMNEGNASDATNIHEGKRKRIPHLCGWPGVRGPNLAKLSHSQHVWDRPGQWMGSDRWARANHVWQLHFVESITGLHKNAKRRARAKERRVGAEPRLCCSLSIHPIGPVVWDWLFWGELCGEEVS